MNLLGKVTKTQLLLLFLTLCYLLSLFFLYERATSTAAGTDYTITVTKYTEEDLTPSAPGPVDINTATSEQLQTLNGIGEAIAQRIIDYRREHGPFTCLEDLLKIKGIGEATLNKFRDHATVSVPDPSGAAQNTPDETTVTEEPTE